MSYADCALCGLPAPSPNDQIVYYTFPDLRDTARVIVHGACAADLIDSGKAYRDGPFSIRTSNVPATDYGHVSISLLFPLSALLGLVISLAIVWSL